ncbi:hypothetical protein THAOC_24771 [Thalassiosira oceanica]|uniref:Uncharacterized protein n=1 Tax=Thalassiosira oceanica TaxID=159749 RepID=K0RQY0_THAOC|nr:hypothetical protein THAOC_24771 [Thalassiosira oceanica]|eukprot:EJK55500.1 hypothetical protein THAOC_24771 [Thalassiosira oceanica]
MVFSRPYDDPMVGRESTARGRGHESAQSAVVHFPPRNVVAEQTGTKPTDCGTKGKTWAAAMTRLTALLLAAMSVVDTAQGFAVPSSSRRTATLLHAGGWGNNQARSVNDEELSGLNSAPIYDEYEIEDRGEFMQRVSEERRSLRVRKAADLLEVARIAGVELKRKEKDPDKLDLFDAEDVASDEDYLDVSI